MQKEVYRKTIKIHYIKSSNVRYKTSNVYCLSFDYE